MGSVIITFRHYLIFLLHFIWNKVADLMWVQRGFEKRKDFGRWTALNTMAEVSLMSDEGNESDMLTTRRMSV